MAVDDDDDEDDEDVDSYGLGPVAEQIRFLDYRPDKFRIDQWDAVFGTPASYVTTRDDQGKRINAIFKQTVLLAATMLKCCPNSHELDTALTNLHTAQLWAINAMLAHE